MYPNFVQWFLKQGPFDAGLSPLKDIEFNRSKSDIKCLDYLAAGIIPLVSDVTPYQSEDLDHYITKVPNEHDAWAQQLTEWVTDPREFRRQKKETARRAQRYIWRNRSSRQTAEKLRENILSLLGNE
jgi:glycosyltransferase involved in cell wall biosynthesis